MATPALPQPAATGAAGDAAQTVPVDPRNEYVAGGTPVWIASYQRTLPPFIDDLTADFGPEVYEQMLRDPQVGSCLTILKVKLLAAGVQVVPARKEGEEDFERAVEIADFCRRQLDRINPDLMAAVLPDMLDALAFGNQVAEQVYELATEGPDKGKLCLKALKVKPRQAVAFVVDACMNVLGILARQAARPEEPGKVVPNWGQEVLPRSKFAVLTLFPKNGDPRGSSLFRCAYTAWWHKLQTWPEKLKYLSQFGTPGIHGTTAEGAQPEPLYDADGSMLFDAVTGQPLVLSPQVVMRDGLLAYRGGGVIVTPFGSTVGLLEPTGNGEVFTNAVSLFNSEIERGILCQTLATSEAKHQARASSEVHQDTLGDLVGYIKAAPEACLRDDVFGNLVRYNFGPEYLHLVPQACLGNVEAQDLAQIWGAVSTLWKSGYLGKSQRRALDAQTGLPERDEEADAKVEQSAEGDDLRLTSSGAQDEEADSRG